MILSIVCLPRSRFFFQALDGIRVRTVTEVQTCALPISSRNFQPSPGTITVYHPPGGPGVRVDTHIYAGYSVPPYYDSLLAKLIVHGNNRAEALARMRQALDSFIIEGVTTTIPFLSRVMRHPDFVAGRVDTKFLEREPQLLQPPT